MKSFLSKVITDVLDKNTSVSNTIFVLPSQRACVFFKNELINQLDHATFLPQIKSIEDFIQELADMKLMDNVQLIFEFYAVYKELTLKENLVSFDTFSQWATVVLHDFNEIDSYLVDTGDFFTYLRDIKRLENWFQPHETPTETAKNYLHFFEKLHEYYLAFYERLAEAKSGYQGLVYREAKNNIEFYIENNSNQQVYFIGFNALNKAEEHIVQELLENKQGAIYWDIHESMMTSNSEAGRFIRKYRKNWPYFRENPFQWVDTDTVENKKINIIGAPKNISQIKYVGELMKENYNIEKTALVMADESLLPVMLNSLPRSVKKINITMGYSLKNVPLTSLFELLFNMYINREKLDVEHNRGYYYKDIIALLNHPFFNRITSGILLENSRNLVDTINEENHIFVTTELLHKELASLDEELWEVLLPLFDFKGGISSVFENCLRLLDYLRTETEGIYREYVFRYFSIFQQLETLNRRFGYISDIKTLNKFFDQLIKNEKLSFRGEPLEGLQLMGMLETRVLDFETVIITSVNEGVLPANKSEQSFIPFDVKKQFQMPTYQEKDAIFSYHFHRLLQRAKKVILLHNTEPDAYGTGEKSRYLTQLEISQSVNQILISPEVISKATELLEIKKSADVIERLKMYASKGISPSALANYIYDPIEFYKQKVLKIKELDEVEETIAVNTMGTVIHHALEKLYEGHIGNFVNSDDIVLMLKKSDELIEDLFKKEFRNALIHTGKNKLILEVSKSFVRRYLNQELEQLKQGKQLKIVALEKELSMDLQVEGLNFPIKIRGIVDRIDELDGVTRIIDYKSGKVLENQLKITDFSILDSDYKYTKALQVMIYTLMYANTLKKPLQMPLEGGIISFKNLQAGFIKMNFSRARGAGDTHITLEKLAEFEIVLKSLITEIFNQEMSFVQKEETPF